MADMLSRVNVEFAPGPMRNPGGERLRSSSQSSPVRSANDGLPSGNQTSLQSCADHAQSIDEACHGPSTSGLNRYLMMLNTHQSCPQQIYEIGIMYSYSITFHDGVEFSDGMLIQRLIQ